MCLGQEEQRLTVNVWHNAILLLHYLAKRQLKPTGSLFSTLLHSMTWSPSHPHRRITGVAAPFRDSQSRQWNEYAIGCTKSNGTDAYEDPKLKNIQQTELLIDLKQAILMTVRHFRQCDPQHADATTQADYSIESHGLDLETYVRTVRHFRQCDPQHADATTQADYSIESHGLDLETYVRVSLFAFTFCAFIID
ncbi:hypothetical protein EG68_02370 [Paragonimus skrjabini miyazakii]|uniref:Uncharacterized protein n=1 Tax=Paragonimus skrjabini miyazakii TaxID=59628 RepID=A0A8S9Z5U0_9TREM|nr:hypothetical protein EG68_02370 [Paragonimus skrjabini miyazakii]